MQILEVCIFFLGDYKEAVSWYKKSLHLEPSNYQTMVYLADAYKFLPGSEAIVDQYLNDAISSSSKQIEMNPGVAKSYQYLARSYAAMGDVNKAKEIISLSNKIDFSSAEAIYANLRIAILDRDYDLIRKLAVSLRNTEYSDKLMLADPDLSVLKEERFRDLFVIKK